MTTFSPAFFRAARSGTVSFFLSSGTEFGLLGALVERPDLPADGIGVRRERGGVHGRGRPGLQVEMTVAIDAAHEHGRVAHLGLAHVGRDVADREADAPVGRAVRRGGRY